MHKQVSVIIPVYNKAEYFSECIESVLAQSLPDIEIIVIDDGSADQSWELVERYAKLDGRIRAFKNESNLGAGVTRNLGLLKSCGRYVQFTDADDVLPNDALITLYRLANNDGVHVARGSLATFTTNPQQFSVDELARSNTRSRFNFLDEKRLWVPWYHTTYLFSRDFLIDNKLSYPNLKCGEDPVFLLSVLLKAPILSATAEVVYLHRTGKGHDRTTFAHLIDYIKHVEQIKRLLMNGYSNVWNEFCSDFFHDHLTRYMNKLHLAESEKQFAIEKISAIWSSPMART
jgi:glycosyltransferase involved in cell wall biosynthesis